MLVENRTLTTDDVLTLVEDILGDNPWVRLGVSTAVGIVAGLAGGHVLRAGTRMAIAMAARHASRLAFDAAFAAGRRHTVVGHAAERSY